MSDSAIVDQTVAQLRGLRDEMRAVAVCPAGFVQTQAVQGWTDQVDAAIADLVEIERRARYADAWAVGAALVDVTVEGPPAPARDQPALF
jgi:hypothetical protein